MHEFVDDGRTGFVVEQNSSHAIAFALKKIISASSDLFSDNQQNCRDFVQLLNWSMVVGKHLDFYSSGFGAG
jgi:hypothetical protein